MEDLFAGKRAIVSGAAGGIGLGLVKGLLKRGAWVLMADVAPEKLEAAAAPLQAQYPGMLQTRVLDVTDEEAFRALAADVAREGGIHFMFNNAGIGCAGFLSKLDEKAIERTLDVNVLGVIHGCRAVIPYMVRDGGGWIVNTGSVASFTPLAWRTIYNTSKFAVLGLTQCLQLELDWMESGIHTAVACPSTVITDIWNGFVPQGGITADEAGEEILQGVERGDAVIPVTDHARELYDQYWHDHDAFDAQVSNMVELYKPMLLRPEHARNIAIKDCRD